MITGNFKGFLIFSIIILIHELGHILPALYYKWNIEKVILLPFGALTLFKEKINKPLKEEFIILISGPLIQIIFTYILLKINYNEDILNYSKLILFFNLLPIYPLDGSKLLNIILNKITNFKKSHLLTIYISFLTIIFLFFKIKISLIFILIIIFIIIKVLEELKNHNNIFNKFLLERYTYNINFKKRKTINNIKQMKRDYKHIIYSKGKYLTEREILRKRFDFKKKIW